MALLSSSRVTDKDTKQRNIQTGRRGRSKLVREQVPEKQQQQQQQQQHIKYFMALPSAFAYGRAQRQVTTTAAAASEDDAHSSPSSWTRDSLLRWQEDVVLAGVHVGGENTSSGIVPPSMMPSAYRAFSSAENVNVHHHVPSSYMYLSGPSSAQQFGSNQVQQNTKQHQRTETSAQLLGGVSPIVGEDRRRSKASPRYPSPIQHQHQQRGSSYSRERDHDQMAIARRHSSPAARRAPSAGGRSVTFAASIDERPRVEGGGRVVSPATTRVSSENTTTFHGGRYQKLLDAIADEKRSKEQHEEEDLFSSKYDINDRIMINTNTNASSDYSPTRQHLSGLPLGPPSSMSQHNATEQAQSVSNSMGIGVRPTVGAGLREVSRRFGGGPDARERATSWALEAAKHEIACHAVQKARNVYERYAVELGRGAIPPTAAMSGVAAPVFGGTAGSFSSAASAASRAFPVAPYALNSSSAAFMSASELGEACAIKNATRRLAHRVDVIGGMPEPIRERRARSSSTGAGRVGRRTSSSSGDADFKWARGKAFTMTPLRPIRDGRFETPGPGSYVIPSEFQGRF